MHAVRVFGCENYARRQGLRGYVARTHTHSDTCMMIERLHYHLCVYVCVTALVGISAAAVGKKGKGGKSETKRASRDEESEGSDEEKEKKVCETHIISCQRYA